MKYLKFSFILFSVMFGLLACVNPTDTSKPTETTSSDTAIAKTIIIVDVRTVEEWKDDGYARCSVNYPLDELGTKVESLMAYDEVMVVCRSGSRAAVAKEMLEQAGIKQVENKGAWQNIDCK